MELQLNQRIAQFYASSTQVILEARIPTFSLDKHSSTATSGRRSKFNLYLRKSSLLIDEMEPWCRGVHEPMVIEIWYLKSKKECSARKFAAHGPLGQEKPILLERWTIELAGQVTGHKELLKGLSTSGDSRERGAKAYNSKVCSSNDARKHAELSAVNKSMVILLRSVYSTTRLLPSQSLFRLLSTSVNCNFRMLYNISAVSPEIDDSIRKDMTHLCLTPLASHGGLFRISVLYRKMVPASEQEAPFLSTRIIHDYVSNSATFQLTPKNNRLPLPKAHSLQERLLQEKTDPKSWEAVQFDYLSKDAVDCPFAVDDECGRTRGESGRLRYAKCDSGRSLTIDKGGGPAASIITLLTPRATLRDNHLHLCVPKKTVAEALKELRTYICSRDSLPSVHSEVK